ncbi:hypothetical protein [Streptomyces sioyaensis]|uniref:hypothetical protein n=1 Tax=Streptomyces sioyaensis TaxID=67364 RepID=UPI0036E07779
MPGQHDRTGLARQIDAMCAAGVVEEHIYVGKRTGPNTDREGLIALLGFVRPGSVPPA